MIRGLLILSMLFSLPGCMGAGGGGVAGVESMYNQGKDIQANQNMNSTQASDLETQVNLLISQLGKMVGIAPTTLYSKGTPSKAFAISQALASAATTLVGSNSVPVVNNDTLTSMRTKILGTAVSMPMNFGVKTAWYTMRFDLIGEMISMQSSYLSLIPQYMLQLLPYMSKKHMQATQSKLETVTKQLQQALQTT